MSIYDAIVTATQTSLDATVFTIVKTHEARSGVRGCAIA
jgi:hypothetical protein